ncbi:hypothetical protein FRB99_004709 [Tulasnella sp. 403]|nr:hypothetical protein FRB99_004709 [Tulasnella sp. 403]
MPSINGWLASPALAIRVLTRWTLTIASSSTAPPDPADPRFQYYMQLQNLKAQKMPPTRRLSTVEYEEPAPVKEGKDSSATWTASFKLLKTEVGRGRVGSLPRVFSASGRSKTEARNAAARELLDTIDYTLPSH